MCAGRDVVLHMVKMFMERLEGYRWEIGTPPEWSATQYPIAGGPTSPMDVTSFTRTG